MEARIALPLDAIRAYCRLRPIRRLAVFGLALREDFSADSDVDLLVDYLPGVPATLLDMAQQELDLAALIGRPVDIRTAAELSTHCRRSVVDAAWPIYEHR